MSPWLIEIIGALAAVIGTICWLPQSLKTIRTKDTKSLSLSANVLLLSAVSLWFIYGLAIGSWPLVVANSVSIVLIGIIVTMKIRYG